MHAHAPRTRPHISVKTSPESFEDLGCEKMRPVARAHAPAVPELCHGMPGRRIRPRDGLGMVAFSSMGRRLPALRAARLSGKPTWWRWSSLSGFRLASIVLAYVLCLRPDRWEMGLGRSREAAERR